MRSIFKTSGLSFSLSVLRFRNNLQLQGRPGRPDRHNRDFFFIRQTKAHVWQRRAEMQSEISVGHTVCGHYWVTDVSRCVCVCVRINIPTQRKHTVETVPP